MIRTLTAFAAYCLLTLALTYPLILNIGSVLPNDAGDPALNTWILWWNTQAAPYTAKWWNAPVFYPAPGVLTFSEILLGLSLFATPLYWLGAGPQAVYNVIFLLTFPLSAIGAYLLALELTGRRDAAFIAGLLFGFAPYRIAHFPQIQALASFPMPFALLGLHRYLREPRLRWLALFGGGWLLQGLCNGYYLLFFSVLVGMWMLWFASPWSRSKTFVAIAAAWFVAALPILPILLHYRNVHAAFGFTRDIKSIRTFSADVAGLLQSADPLLFWGHLDVFDRAEGELFPGLTVALLLAAGALFVRERKGTPVGTWRLARRVLLALTLVSAAAAVSAVLLGPWRFEPFDVPVLSVSNPTKPLTFSLALAIGLAVTSATVRRAYATRSVAGFYVLAAFVTWLFSLGPAPTLLGHPLMYRGPYALLMPLPGFSSLRVPARFWMLTILCLAMVAAVVFDRLAARLGGVRGGVMRTALATIIAAGVIADTWLSEMPLAATPTSIEALTCAGQSSHPVLELPLGDNYRDVAAMYRQMFHRRPVVNGYSGYFPLHYVPLRRGLLLKDPDVITQLASYATIDIVVDHEEDPGRGWERYLRSHAAVKPLCTAGKQSLYRTIAVPASAEAAAIGTPLRPAVIRANVNQEQVPFMVDGDVSTRWESGPQDEGIRVDVDLGAVRRVQGVDLSLGRFVEDYPRQMVIEASLDGLVWEEQWRGHSAGRAVVASFDSRGIQPMRYRFAPIEARVVRLRLAARDEIYYWSIAELSIAGAP